jgi:hypothetical protein
MALDFRLDRTRFAAMTFEEADKEINDYSEFTWQERLEISYHLTSIAFNFSKENPPRMEKGLFEVRNLSNG